MEQATCPGCGSALARVVDGGLHYVCGACHGQMVGLAPFERAHPAARQVWVASSSGAAAGTCPFCHGALVAPAMDAPPPGLAVCRRCEQLWVPADAAAWFEASTPPAGAVPAAPARPARPDACPGCGAPWAPDPGGRCHYCHEQLTAEPTTVIVQGGPARPGVLDVLFEVAEHL